MTVMATYRVAIDRSLCSGFALCVEDAPDVFALDARRVVNGLQLRRRTTGVQSGKCGIELIDLNEPKTWKVAFVIHPDLKPHPVKIAQTMVDPNNYIISLTRLKSHLQVGATLTAKNVIMGSLMIMDKNRMHPTEAGNRVLDYNLFTVMQHLHIDLAVLDGFEGMEGNGPVNGTPVDHRIAIAGKDYLAVDRVGTEVMGLDFDNIRYLNYLWDYGFGEADLGKIQVVGETIESCRKTYNMAPRFLKMRRQESKGMYQDLAVDLG